MSHLYMMLPAEAVMDEAKEDPFEVCPDGFQTLVANNAKLVRVLEEAEARKVLTRTVIAVREDELNQLESGTPNPRISTLVVEEGAILPPGYVIIHRKAGIPAIRPTRGRIDRA